jgi:Zn-dependent metalloprotease
MLQQVAEKATGEARRTALDTLAEMAALKSELTGGLLPQRNGVAASSPRKRRNVYDAHNRRRLPGQLVMSDHRSRSGDVEVNEAFDGSGDTYDFFEELFARKSIDDAGGRIESTVHYGMRFDNAFWNGRQMIYGDGDGILFTRFTIALEVIAHELTHGITQHSANLRYEGQTGALNEHLSDAFGIMVKQRKLGLSAGESDWLIGAGLFAPGVAGQAIRSMAAPGTAYDDPRLGRDPQPAHMRDYVRTVDDNGGVHINSGILNRAFYLAAIALGGEPWTVLGIVWYVTMTKKLRPSADFQAFVNATTSVAGELYGSGGSVQRTIAQAWMEVGLPPAKTPARVAVKKTPPPIVLPSAFSPREKWRTRTVQAVKRG